MQSHDYVPGVSGWKFDPESSEFELNTCTLGSAGKAPERQVVSIEVASYSKYDLPKNAANLVQFMEAELQRVPEEYRHAAEFEDFDASYGDESFSSRLFLSYSRLETEQELTDRLERARVSGTKLTMKNGILSISQDGVLRCRVGNLDAPDPERDTAVESAKPFVVVGGTTYLNEAFIKDGTISAKLATNWSVRMGLHNDQYVATGIGLGLDSQFSVSADRFAIKEQTNFDKASSQGFDAVLKLLVGVIGESHLYKGLLEEIEKLKLERTAKAGSDDADWVALDRRLAAMDHRLANLESNRFRRPNTN